MIALFTDAFDRNIMIVTTSTLIATLRITGVWRQENQNCNALEIARKSGELHDKFRRICWI
jgi:DNA recombination protein RmuC